jgi:hypothetical protein
MRIIKKQTLIILITSLLFYGSSAYGQELVPLLKGKWVGTVLVQATSTGFSSLKNTISLNISEQSSLEFKGNAERKKDGKNISWNFGGYLDKKGRNNCLINQNNKNILIGYMINNNLIKLYSWENDENNKVVVYILKKNESGEN